MNYDIPKGELEYYSKHPVSSIESLLVDGDFQQDVREMLISGELPEEPESGRILDLQRVQLCIATLDREQLTAMLLEYSLCPVHRIDYAICFDDETESCAAVRFIHPGHDT